MSARFPYGGGAAMPRGQAPMFSARPQGQYNAQGSQGFNQTTFNSGQYNGQQMFGSGPVQDQGQMGSWGPPSSSSGQSSYNNFGQGVDDYNYNTPNSAAYSRNSGMFGNQQMSGYNNQNNTEDSMASYSNNWHPPDNPPFQSQNTAPYNGREMINQGGNAMPPHVGDGSADNAYGSYGGGRDQNMYRQDGQDRTQFSENNINSNHNNGYQNLTSKGYQGDSRNKPSYGGQNQPMYPGPNQPPYRGPNQQRFCGPNQPPSRGKNQSPYGGQNQPQNAWQNRHQTQFEDQSKNQREFDQDPKGMNKFSKGQNIPRQNNKSFPDGQDMSFPGNSMLANDGRNISSGENNSMLGQNEWNMTHFNKTRFPHDDRNQTFNDVQRRFPHGKSMAPKKTFSHGEQHKTYDSKKEGFFYDEQRTSYNDQMGSQVKEDKDQMQDNSNLDENSFQEDRFLHDDQNMPSTSNTEHWQRPPTSHVTYNEDFIAEPDYAYAYLQSQSNLSHTANLLGHIEDHVTTEPSDELTEMKKDIVRFLASRPTRKIKKGMFWSKFRGAFPKYRSVKPSDFGYSKNKALLNSLKDIVNLDSKNVVLRDSKITKTSTVSAIIDEINARGQDPTPNPPKFTGKKKANKAKENWSTFQRRRRDLEKSLEAIFSSCPNGKMLKNDTTWSCLNVLLGNTQESSYYDVNSLNGVFTHMKSTITSDCSARQIAPNHGLFLKLKKANVVELDTYHPRDQLLKYRLLAVVKSLKGYCTYQALYKRYFELFQRYPYAPGILPAVIKNHFSKELEIDNYFKVRLGPKSTRLIPTLEALSRARSAKLKVYDGDTENYKPFPVDGVNLEVLHKDVVRTLSVLKFRRIEKGRFFYQFRKYTENVTRRKFSTEKYGLKLEVNNLDVLYAYMADVVHIVEDRNKLYVQLLDTPLVESLIVSNYKSNVVEVLNYVGGKFKLRQLLIFYRAFYGNLPLTKGKCQSLITDQFTDVIITHKDGSDIGNELIDKPTLWNIVGDSPIVELNYRNLPPNKNWWSFDRIQIELLKRRGKKSRTTGENQSNSGTNQGNSDTNQGNIGTNQDNSGTNEGNSGSYQGNSVTNEGYSGSYEDNSVTNEGNSDTNQGNSDTNQGNSGSYQGNSEIVKEDIKIGDEDCFIADHESKNLSSSHPEDTNVDDDDDVVLIDIEPPKKSADKINTELRPLASIDSQGNKSKDDNKKNTGHKVPSKKGESSMSKGKEPRYKVPCFGGYVELKKVRGTEAQQKKRGIIKVQEKVSRDLKEKKERSSRGNSYNSASSRQSSRSRDEMRRKRELDRKDDEEFTGKSRKLDRNSLGSERPTRSGRSESSRGGSLERKRMTIEQMRKEIEMERIKTEKLKLETERLKMKTQMFSGEERDRPHQADNRRRGNNRGYHRDDFRNYEEEEDVEDDYESYGEDEGAYGDDSRNVVWRSDSEHHRGGSSYEDPDNQQLYLPGMSGNYIIQQGTMTYTPDGQPVIIPHRNVPPSMINQNSTFENEDGYYEDDY